MLILLLTLITESFACGPGEIFVRAHSVSPYTRGDGVAVSGYDRGESCRELLAHYEFNDKDPELSVSKYKIIPWRAEEQKIVEGLLAKLPVWLQKYKLQKILRAKYSPANIENPAITLPASKVLIINNSFFKRKDQLAILTHEMAHVAVLDCNSEDVKKLLQSSGWILKGGKAATPPTNLLLPDSKTSRSEDFANHVEIFYSDPVRLKNFNLSSYEILRSIIDRKEKEK